MIAASLSTHHHLIPERKTHHDAVNVMRGNNFQQLLEPDSLKPSASNFTQTIKNQVQDFLSFSRLTEAKINDYARGENTIENIAPLVSQLSVEVEAFSKIVESFVGIPKTLLSIPI